ncbi:MAG: LemA family protein [Candidatus Aenigmarchaeota archaeon]|nr:LemA family protein [Candidatus Aenigmarchaeota archaeon]
MELLLAVIGIIIAIVVIGYIIIVFNGLVRLKNNIRKSWANIDVLLKQRSDELPKLVDTVKGYIKYEKRILTEITQARTAFLNADTMQDKARADGLITGALKSLFAVAENYPNLKANESFIQLQGRISSLENEIADRREFYNDSVNTYNIRIQTIPDRFVAGMLHYQPEELFKAAEAERRDVKIDIGMDNIDGTARHSRMPQPRPRKRGRE